MGNLKLLEKVKERIVTGMKRFQGILADAKKSDANETDTMRIITGMLSEIFGFSRYKDVKAEHEIRGTYCDLAVHIDDKPLISQ